ncbi:glyceraldehyde-3-phosphate dehydrogenase (NAD(P)) [Flavobacterium sp. CG_23.5]|uniref:type II glyceraldehyde-3-phosphate dehydrogenase n=1 Tax=unclassified Flavobacterium TaxID=196869 RepID=UPI0018CAD9EE|nr:MULTISPECIES: type II glyceraldehyde-3-phosphate dehydrogenase [unclassified Flavobacterium]MBG6110442.1 glyceraldehyde-3-phosphate dehydrogenase (NAD(P)) [Flavobacterium sp. CG_9.10]MBP2284131.1 glyceraldehyde-3-phosphate dehydrogenase (NAD(P)) [Flavobacterium sp. CG_23.5]
MKKIRVAVNGYGVIGKRIADAILLQDDMELVGIVDLVTDWRIKAGATNNLPVFAFDNDSFQKMKASGIDVKGTLDDLLKNVDLVCDATPKKVAALNFEKYKNAGVKSIFQGGEKHELTGHSFVAQANYASAIGRDSTRVVSCNTTSIVRINGALHQSGLFKKGNGVLVRRATDPWESDHSGIMNTIVPETTVPSHQGPDAQTIIPGLEITTVALVAAQTTSHFHSWHVELARPCSREEIISIFEKTPRVIFLRESDGLTALNHTIELMSDLGRPRGDMWEVGLWIDSLKVIGNELYFNYQVYNQAIVVPETIDAIRALTGIEKEATASINKTNNSMGIIQGDVFKNLFK